jgi:hypothetical protein
MFQQTYRAQSPVEISKDSTRREVIDIDLNRTDLGIAKRTRKA